MCCESCRIKWNANLILETFGLGLSLLNSPSLHLLHIQDMKKSPTYILLPSLLFFFLPFVSFLAFEQQLCLLYVSFFALLGATGSCVDVLDYRKLVACFFFALDVRKILCLDTNYPPIDGNVTTNAKCTGWCHTSASNTKTVASLCELLRRLRIGINLGKNWGRL